MKHFIIAVFVLVFAFSSVAFAGDGDLVADSFTFDTVSLTSTEDGLDIYAIACQGGMADHCKTDTVWVSSETNDLSRGIEVVEYAEAGKGSWLLKIGASTVDSLPSDHFVEVPYFFNTYYSSTTINFSYLNYRDEGGELYVVIGATDAGGNVIWENYKSIQQWDEAYYGYKAWIRPELSESDILEMTEGRPFNFIKIVEDNITSAAGASYLNDIFISGAVTADQAAVDEMLDGFVPEPAVETEPEVFGTASVESCPEPEIVEVIKEVTVEVIKEVEVVVEVEVPVEVEVIRYVEVVKYIYIDHDNGHGNDVDGHDESNPGKSGGTKKK